MLENLSIVRRLSVTCLPMAVGAVAIGALSLGATPLGAAPFASSGLATTVASEKAATDDRLLVEVGHRDGHGHRYGDRDYRDRYEDRYYYGRPIHRQHRYDPGAAVAAGVIGLAAGAIISGALAPQPLYNVPAQPVYRVGPQPVYRVPARPVHRVSPAPGDRLIGRYTATDIAYCTRRYGSFDPASFTFLGYDGRRHYCRVP